MPLSLGALGPCTNASISMSMSIGKLSVALSSTIASTSSSFACDGALPRRFRKIEIDSASDQSWITVIIT